MISGGRKRVNRDRMDPCPWLNVAMTCPVHLRLTPYLRSVIFLRSRLHQSVSYISERPSQSISNLPRSRVPTITPFQPFSSTDSYVDTQFPFFFFFPSAFATFASAAGVTAGAAAADAAGVIPAARRAAVSLAWNSASMEAKTAPVVARFAALK